MNAPPYQKLFWGSYHKHTAHLSHAREHGAYLLLIGALWNNEGRLPADDETLAGYAKLTVKEWLAIKPKLVNGSLLKIMRGKLIQPRVTEDLAKYRDTSGKRKQAGKAGGLASGGKRAENREANASVLPTKPEPEPKEDNPLPPRGTRTRKPETPLPDGCPSADLVSAMQAEAREIGANIDLSFEARQFRDWWTAKDGRNRDWAAAWRTWARRAIGRAPKTAAASLSGRQAPSNADARWRSRVREFKSNRYWPTDDAGPRPGAPGCKAPAHILAEFGLAGPPANDTPPLFAEEDAA